MPWVSASRLGRERDSGFFSRQPAPAVDISEEGEETVHYGSTGRPPPPPPFQFGYKRHPIDWRVLHGVDIERLVRETDIEALERCVGAVAFGDLEAEDSRNLTETNFMRIFRLGQLTAEYLLHVQDRLAYDNCLLKDDRAQKEKHLEALRLRCKEHKEKLASAKQDIRRLKKTMKTIEDAAKQEQPVAVPAPVPAPAMPAADTGHAWKLERLERQQRELQAERSMLQQEVANLRSELLKRTTEGKEELESEVGRTRSEERRVAQQRLRIAQSEAQELRRRLDRMASRQLELQKAKECAVAGVDGTLQTLTSKSQRQEEDLQALKAELAQKDDLLDSMESKAAEEAARAESRMRHLEHQLAQATQDLDASSVVVQDVGSLQQDIEALKDKVRQLKEEHQRITAENSSLQRDNSELDEKLHGLEVTLETTLKRQQREDKEEAERERLQGENAAAEAAEERQRAAHKRSVSVPPPARPRTPPRARVPLDEPVCLPPPSASRPWVAEVAPSVPPRSEQAKWDREHPYELRPWDRPGVLSRTRITRAAFLAERPEIEELLEAELEEELLSYGIDPKAERLNDELYKAALVELENRQAAAAADTTPETAARIKQIRNVLAWHVHKVADSVDKEYSILPNGQVAAQQAGAKAAVRSPPPGRQRSRSVSPKKSSSLLGKLCSRFRSPSTGDPRHKAIAAYRDTYGHDPIGAGPLPRKPTQKEMEKRDLKEASERFYQPLRAGTGSLTQEEMPTSKAIGTPVKSKLHRPASPKRLPGSPRSPKLEMTTVKRVGPNKPHGTICQQAMESISRQETLSEFEEETDVPNQETGTPKSATRKIVRRKVTEVQEVTEPSSARRDYPNDGSVQVRGDGAFKTEGDSIDEDS